MSLGPPARLRSIPRPAHRPTRPPRQKPGRPRHHLPSNRLLTHMPNEPDNDKQKPIHQWLEAYARRRREQAGEPIPLHPATRRLWHSEISRQYPGAIPGSSAGAFLNWLRFRWPRLVIGLGAAALLAVSVTAVLWQTPRPTGALPRAERSAATANDQPVPGDALAHLSPQPKAVTMTPADEQRSDKLSPAATAPARPAGLASAEPKEKAAASPAGRTGRFNEPADARSPRAPSSPAATPPRPIASPELAGPKPTQAPLPSAPGREVVPALIVAQADDASRRPVTAVADAGQAANPSLNRFLALA